MALITKFNSHANRMAWQRFLASLGFVLEIDGIDGPATARATVAFQRGEGVTADGVVGDSTVQAAVAKGFAGFGEAAIASAPQVAVIEDKNLARLNGCHPQLKEKVSTLVGLAANEGYTLRVVQGLRTFAQQDDLYAIGRTRPGKKVTNARGGQSNHNYGVAADLAFVVDGNVSWDDKLYPNIGRWAKQSGLEWGGDWKKFKDLPHVELPNCPNWRKLLEVHKTGGLNAVWALFGE